VFLVNSRLGLVSATFPCSVGMPRHKKRHPFFRRYGVNLPSSLTRVLSIALVSSTHLPVSVCGTGTGASTLRGFSRQCGLNDSTSPSGRLVPVLPHGPGDLPPRPGYTGTRTMSIGPLSSTLLRHPIAPRWW
jgi:hypothetical protein